MRHGRRRLRGPCLHQEWRPVFGLASPPCLNCRRAARTSEPLRKDAGMVRCSLMLRLGVVAVLALIPVVLIANPPGSEDAAFKNALALQQAMEMARHHL